jgi:hypothetical protein
MLAPRGVEGDRLLFRDMDIGEDGGPMVEPFSWALGVRTEGKPRDIVTIGMPGKPFVEPNPDRPEGMSVAPDDPLNLHPRHRPPELGGTGNYPVWSIRTGQLGLHLRFRRTSPTHGVIEPATRMSLSAYVEALAATRPHWTRVVG